MRSLGQDLHSLQQACCYTHWNTSAPVAVVGAAAVSADEVVAALAADTAVAVEEAAERNPSRPRSAV